MSDHRQRPTWGQRTQLQRLCRVDWVLIGLRSPTEIAPRYELRERAPGSLGGWARIVHTVHPRMVEQLTAAGWIERAGGTAGEWWYKITSAGVWAAQAPQGLQDGGHQP